MKKAKAKRKYVSDLMTKVVQNYFEKLKEDYSHIHTLKDMYEMFDVTTKKQFIKTMNIEEGLTVKDLAEGEFDISYEYISKT